MKHKIAICLIIVLVAMSLGFATKGKSTRVRDFPTIIKQVSVSIVEVRLKGTAVTGSGFYIGDGYVGTARHILRAGEIVSVTFEDGTSCKVLGTTESKDADGGLIKIEKVDKKPLLFDADGIVKGEEVLTIGNPKGFSFMCSTGIISGTAKNSSFGPVVYVYTAQTSNGSSGGPVIDTEGDVVGVHVGFRLGTAYKIMVPISYLRDMLKVKKIEPYWCSGE